MNAEQQLQACGERAVELAREIGLTAGYHPTVAPLKVLERAYAMAIAEAIDFKGQGDNPDRTRAAIETLRKQLEDDVKLQVFYRGRRI